MDRPEPGLVKWSPNSSVDSFVHINLQHRVVQLYQPTGHARNGRFDYTNLNKHDDFPPLTTYDWSPADPGLLAVGTGTGIVNVLRIDDGSNAYAELGLKMARTCHAVAFNTGGLLAVGLDRVRMDHSLHVWDVNRLSLLEKGDKIGFKQASAHLSEPPYRLEASVSVSSIKFFEDSPQTLVAGIKGQGLRIHDLRDHVPALSFQTKCNNNIAIDYADQNYFASSALDHPGVMIWDRRATSRQVSSSVYQQAVDEDELPWGGSLRLDSVVAADSDPNSTEGKHSLIRSLRYCRDHRGLLAVLSRTGQLKVLETNREGPAVNVARSDGPELLEVKMSHDLDVFYPDMSRKNDRIVSFDWVTLGSPVLQPRLLALRANGVFDILEQPSHVADYTYKLVPWQAPHRGLEEGTPYHEMMQFEPSQGPGIIGPSLVQQTLSDIPLFGPDKIDLEATIQHALDASPQCSLAVEDKDALGKTLPESVNATSSTASKLRALRKALHDGGAEENGNNPNSQENGERSVEEEMGDLSLVSEGVGSSRQIHERLLTALKTPKGLASEGQSIVDHAMLLKAKEKYLFDPAINRTVNEDDPWIKYLWDWIADAEDAADDGGMVVTNIDLSYLGVYSIWFEDFGRNPAHRLQLGQTMPDGSQWERTVGQYCKKRRLPKFDNVPTKRPHLRQLCLEICGWGDEQKHSPKALDSNSYLDYPTSLHTRVASRALFRGETSVAIQVLKLASASRPELLFVTLALQLMGRGNKHLAREQLDFDQEAASKTDPYLRAISSLIATGDWATIANQTSLPLADRAYVAVRNLSDEELSAWLKTEVERAVAEGDIEAIVLTGITDTMVDIFARYVQKFHDVQTATLVTSICAPRFIDDIRCRAWRSAYRDLLQRHKFFFQRTKFEVESTKRSKRDGVPTLKPPSRQIALRCVFCDAETSLNNQLAAPPPPAAPSAALEARNPLLATSINAGVSCPNCGRHLPRCVVCLEIVGVPRSDRPGEQEETRMAGRFPTFCLKCDHVQHLDHARQWFARHAECPVPECRCRCNFRANPELSYH